MTTEHQARPAALVKLRALSYLVEHRRQTRHAPYTVDASVHAGAMGRILGVPLHDLVHTLWDLQKQDAIRFRERKYARGRVGRGDLDQFVVTARGMALLDEAPPAELEAALPPVTTGEPVDVAAFMTNTTGREWTAPEAPRPPGLPPIPQEVLELFGRRELREALEAAAALCDSADMPDVAVMILDRLPPMTPAELGILGYLDQAGVSPERVPLLGGHNGTKPD